MHCEGSAQQEGSLLLRKPIVYTPSQFCAGAATTSSHMEDDAAVRCGVKRKREVDGDDEAPSVDELRECLFNTCISKLTSPRSKSSSGGGGGGVGSQHRRMPTLRHSVLIQNMLRSLHTARTQTHGPITGGRARVTARRLSAETHDDAPMAVCEDNQELERPSSSSLWQQDQHISSSWEQDNSEVTSSPTATLVSVPQSDASVPDITSPPSRAAGTPKLTELEPLDVSSYFFPHDSDINFFEPQIPLSKTESPAAGASSKLDAVAPMICVYDSGKVVEMANSVPYTLVFVQRESCSTVLVKS